MNICVIPARGGSKRIPRKNIKSFCGQPMISYSIVSALESKIFDHIIVSTDDDEIAEVSLKYGASVPFIRPENLSDDYTTTTDVIAHALSWVQKNIGNVKFVCTLYATAPFTTSKELISAYEEISKHKDCHVVFPIVEFDFPIQRAIKLTDDGSVKMFQPEHLLTRSQDLEKAYHDAGQFYWMKSKFIGSGISPFSDVARPIKIPHYRVQDIDTKDDWIRAEIMFEAMNFNNKK
jgi:pseudaminic acid cytidylyltransferase